MLEQMPEPYEGGRPYIMVSYARADAGAARSIIRALADAGYRVWWDKGIKGGIRFSDDIANRVHGCACVVVFVSSSSVASDWCKSEVEYALDLKKDVLPIYLEDVELPRALQMRLGGVQALFWYAYESDDEFNEDLFAVRLLDSCLTEEGKSARGVKARGAEAPEADAVSQADVMVNDAEKADAGDSTSTSVQLESNDDEQADEPRRHLNLAHVAKVVCEIVIGLLIGSLIGNAISGFWHQEEPTEIPIISLNDESEQEELVQGVPVRDKLDDYKWSELKVLSRAIADARSNDDWLKIAKQYHLVDEDGKLQGDEKVFTLDDGTKTSIRILGFRHDELASGSRAGITFEFADVPVTHMMNEHWINDGGWEKSAMREWLNSEFLSSLPSGLQSCIETVEKETNNIGLVESEDDASVVTATEDKLWLLSMTEVYGFTDGIWSSATYDAEGDQYKLYADKGVTTTNYGFSAKDGARSWWWLRSPFAFDSRWFHGVVAGGVWYWSLADYDWGVSPGFCF